MYYRIHVLTYRSPPTCITEYMYSLIQITPTCITEYMYSLIQITSYRCWPRMVYTSMYLTESQRNEWNTSVDLILCGLRSTRQWEPIICTKWLNHQSNTVVWRAFAGPAFQIFSIWFIEPRSWTGTSRTSRIAGLYRTCSWSLNFMSPHELRVARGRDRVSGPPAAARG